MQHSAAFAPPDHYGGSPSEPEADVARPAMWSMPDHGGENYRVVLQRFHEFFAPETYLEIGVADGTTLQFASCASIGVDPDYHLTQPATENKPACLLYRTTSDLFFRHRDPTAIFGQPIDMAFLDGMHWFEFLLRDFINVERHCKPNTVVFIHDCIPTDSHAERRDPNDHRLRASSANPDWWAGDVWKVIAILLKHRPDLRLLALDAIPTGLIAVTNLNPRSTVLADRYFDLVAEYRDQTLADHGQRYLEDLRVADTRHYASREVLSSLFWL